MGGGGLLDDQNPIRTKITKFEKERRGKGEKKTEMKI